MLYHWIYESFGPAGFYVVTVVFGMAFYAALASASYFTFFVWKRNTFHPDYRPDAQELMRSVKWALFGIAGNGVLIFPIQILIVNGHGRVYYSLDEFGLGFTLLSFVGAVVFAESAIYWIHRALHTKFLYRSFHIYHHRFREPTPVACISFHPIDSFAQSLPYHLYALIVPIHFWAYLGLIAFVTVWAVMIHDRIRWVPFAFVNHTGCHTAHHVYYAYNYGQFFTFWDRLCGTYRDSMDLPDRYWAARTPVFGGASPRSASKND